MKKSPKIGGGFFQLRIYADRVVRFDFSERIKVQLPNKRAELGVFEELRYNFLFEFRRVLYDECLSVVRPSAYRRIARIDQVVRFCMCRVAIAIVLPSSKS